MEKFESYGKVKLSKVKAAIAQIEEHYQDCPERLEDVDITFEYLIGSFFPTIVKNIQTEHARQNMLGFKDGYEQGLEAGRNENKERQG